MANEKRLIDANAFKEFLEDVRQAYREEDTLSSGFAACLIETVQDEYLALAPTVDAVEVVHGRWDKVKQDLGDGIKTYRFGCSECGFLKNTLTGNYCPNCGADMRERKDNG